MPQIQGTWGYPTVINPQINEITRSKLLFYVEIVRGHYICLQTGIRGIFLPKELATNKTVLTDKTIKTVLAGKPPPPPSRCYMLEGYDKQPILIFIDITKDVVQLVARKFLRSSSPGGADSDALQG